MEIILTMLLSVLGTVGILGGVYYLLKNYFSKKNQLKTNLELLSQLPSYEIITEDNQEVICRYVGLFQDQYVALQPLKRADREDLGLLFLPLLNIPKERLQMVITNGLGTVDTRDLQHKMLFSQQHVRWRVKVTDKYSRQVQLVELEFSINGFKPLI